jgi:ADP-ribosyl-[dinitrogen reductase] hydrolase
MPFEKPRDEVHPDLATWDGSYQPGTWHKLPAGHWTDDTEMAVALAGSLIDNNEFVPVDVAKSYLLWFQGTPHGAGSTTKKAMANLANGQSWAVSGVPIHDDAAVGNGPAMRIAPIGVFYRPNGPVQIAASLDALITHQNAEAMAGSVLIALLISTVVESSGRDNIADLMPKVLEEKLLATKVGQHALLATRLAHGGNTGNPTDEQAMVQLGRRGNIIQTVGSAVYFAQRYSGLFEEGVTAAVRAGGDADTRGAIVGAILGAEVGLEGIPQKYLDGLHEVAMLKRMDEELLALRR